MKILFLFLIISFYINSILSNNFDGLGSNRSRDRDNLNTNKEVLIISTLDGNLYGIDVHNGKSLWTIANTPLVSQSLSNLEFVKDGKTFRLIPSLEGQLYMLDVDSNKKGLHALPITADALFTSSFQLSSDSLLVGGKEQRVLGFNPLSGEIKYQCGKDGCQQGPTLRSEKESCDLLLCRRISHIVRAVDIESGQEKWNFSVGQDDVLTANTASYPQSPTGGFVEESILTKGGCVMSTEDSDDGGIQWSFNVERGIVQAASQAPFSIVRWRKELGSSLSRVWLLRGRSVRPLSIFARDADSHLEHASDESGCPIHRSLFLGSHDGHLYVQLEDGSARRSPRPIYVALPSTTSPSSKRDLGLVTTTRHRVSKVTRYIPPLQQGFFRPSLIHDEADVSKKWFTFQDNNECYPFTSDPLVVRFGSFLFQKAVFLCLVLIVLHLIFKKVYLPYQMAKLQDSSQSPLAITNPNNGTLSSPVSVSSSLTDSMSHISRYESDYEHIRCLGRGAFGVVFEARHRVDQYHYAVKRVRVRYSPQARDKLLQEVQAFAHLEHPGIVRYYQAWFELPPGGWQEQRDKDRSLIVGQDLGSDLGTGTSVSRSESSTTSLTCGDSNENNWSTVSVGDRSRDPRIDGDSLVIFDRSVSVDPIKNTVASSMWATQLSLTSSGDASDSTQSVSGQPSFTTPSNQWQPSSMTPSNGRPQSSKTPSNRKHRKASSKTPGSNGRPPSSMDPSHSHSAQPPSTSLVSSVSQSTSNPTNCSHIYLFISMHLYTGTTLQQRLQQPLDQRADRDTHLGIFAQIVDAVAYLHCNGLMHRDLKPSNILFDTQDHIRIVDFGLATPLIRTKSVGSRQQSRKGLHTSNVGTELYMSPEQQKGSQYDQKVDIFALGIIFLELMVPLSTAMERVIVLTKAKKLKFDKALKQRYPEEISLASQLLDPEPKNRPSCEEILCHSLLIHVSDRGRSKSKSRSVSFNM